MLPSELLNIVFRHLPKDDLLSCALVSSYFTGPAQDLLFSNVFLLPQPSRPLIARSLSVTPAQRATYSYECPRSESQPPLQTHLTQPNACVKLLATLEESPHLAQYIRTLTVVEGRLFPHSAASRPTLLHDPVLSSLDNHAAINGPQWLASTPPQLLYSLFELIKRGRLREVNLLYPDGPKTSWALIPRDVRNAFRFLFAQTDGESVLERVEIRNIAFDNTSALSELTSALANGTIRHLTLRGIKLLDAPNSQIRARGRSTTRREFGSSPSAPLTHSPTPLRGRQRGKGRALLHGNSNSHSLTKVGNVHEVLANDCPYPTLDTVCLSSSSFDPVLASQAPETVLLLRALLLGVGSESEQPRSPLINVPSLKNLLIPGIPIVNIPEAINVLKDSSVCNTLDTLEFNNLTLHSASLYPPIGVDFKALANIKKLLIEIHLNYNSTICYCPSPITPITPFQRPIRVVNDKNHLVSWLTDSLASLHHQNQNSVNEIKLRLSCDPTTPGIMQYQQSQLMGLAGIVHDLRRWKGVDVKVDIEMDSLFQTHNNNYNNFRGRGKPHNHVESDNGGERIEYFGDELEGMAKLWLEKLF